MLRRCCCFRLQTGGMIIGWLNVVGSLIAVIVISCILANVDDFIKMITHSTSEMDNDGLRSMLRIVFSVSLALSIINLLSSSMLIIGVVKERHLLIVPWLIMSGISLALNTLSFLGMTIKSFGDTSGPGPIFVILFAIFVLGFGYYIWYAMHSLFRLIRDGNERQRLMPVYSTNSAANPMYNKI